MSKITRITTTTLAAIIMLGGSVVANPTNVQASAPYKRSKITKVKKANYYSIKNAKTYKMTGSAKKLKLKASHNLKNYNKSTWVRTKKTYITKHGKKYLYYYVTSQKNGAKGWVWHKYLKAGKNYQMANAKGLQSKNYIKAKSGKIYQLQGSNKYMKFTNGKVISAKKTYKATQQRHIYKNGKTYKYYYVTNGKASGWTWNKYLKAGTYHAPAKNSASQATPSSSPASSSASQSSSQAGSLSNKPTEPTKPVNNDKTYNASVVASDMVSQINQARAKLGSAALTYNGALEQVGNVRAVQIVNNFSHRDASGNTYTEPLAKKYGIWDDFATEDIGIDSFDTTNQKTANAIITAVGHSEDHWDDLMNPSFSKIGVGLNKTTDGTIYIAIQLGF